MLEANTLKSEIPPEDRQEGLSLVLTQPQLFSDPARCLLSCLEGPG